MSRADPPRGVPSVCLRPLVPDDIEAIVEWNADPVFVAHAGWSDDGDVDAVRTWWRQLIASPPPELIRLAAVQDDEVVGTVDLHGEDEGFRELGYEVGPSSRWGAGVGTALASAGLDYGFEVLGLDRIWAEAVDANAASVRTLQRIRMRETGWGGAEPFLGRPSRYRQFEITRAEWSAARA